MSGYPGQSKLFYNKKKEEDPEYLEKEKERVKKYRDENIKRYKNIQKIVVCTGEDDIVSPPCDSFSPKLFAHSVVIILIICLSARIQAFV